jgi:hypothetical protein
LNPLFLTLAWSCQKKKKKPEGNKEDMFPIYKWECILASDVHVGERTSSFTKELMKGGNFLKLFEDVRLRCTRHEVELFAIIARRIWLRRNDVVHGGCFTHPSQVLPEQ